MEYLGSTSMDRYDPAKTNTVSKPKSHEKKVPTGPTIKSGYVMLPRRDLRPLTQYELPESIFDPYSDPKNPHRLTLNDISSAAVLLKGSIEKTPCTAVSFYGRKLDISLTVVVPKGTSIQKVHKCRNFNARVIVEGRDMGDVKAAAQKLAKEKGFFYLNGCDHADILAGAGTIGIEILEDVPEPDAVIVPVGSGGLIAGVAVAIKALSPRTQIIGVESDKCPCFCAALDYNQPVHTHAKKSLANGLSIPMAGYNAFFTAQPLIDKMVVVREEWLTLAMLRLAEEEKCVVEGAGATGLAALLTGLLVELKGKKVVVILSGGNVDTALFSRSLERGLAADGRFIKFSILISDKPGGGFELMELLTHMAVTIRNISHKRQEDPDVFLVRLTVRCETRDWNHSLDLQNELIKHYGEFGELQFGETPLVLQDQFVPEPPPKKTNKPCARYVQPQQNILL